MQTTKKLRAARWLVVVAVMTMLAAACSSSSDDTTTTTDGGTPTELVPVSMQLQWFPQAQFAGYYAAKAQGFYEEVGLDVTLLDGGVDIVPATVLGAGGADFAESWAVRALGPREEGANIVNIAQVFERSATLQVAFADSGITSVADLAGRNVGTWGFGNEAEVYAGLRMNGLDPATDVNIVQQQFDMLAFIAGDIDAAQAMTYNEYAQVLESINPETGELFKPEDLFVIDWNEVGSAMLQDGIWADAGRLESDPEYREIAVKFVEASLRGWAFCRDNFDACLADVLAVGPTLGEGHQRWMLNEVNKLIWPSSAGIGMMDGVLWRQTIDNALAGQLLAADPGADAYRTDIVQEALDNLRAKGIDVDGTGYTPLVVELTEGGE